MSGLCPKPLLDKEYILTGTSSQSTVASLGLTLPPMKAGFGEERWEAGQRDEEDQQAASDKSSPLQWWRQLWS